MAKVSHAALLPIKLPVRMLHKRNLPIVNTFYILISNAYQYYWYAFDITHTLPEQNNHIST